MTRHRVLGLATACGLLAGPADPVGAQATDAQARNLAPEPARQLVVQVLSYFGTTREPEVGAGIIVASTSRFLYIATAGHVVRRGPTRVRDVRVVFPAARSDSVRATLHANVDTLLDLAVLSVPYGSVKASVRTALEFDRRGAVRSLKSGDPVSPVGCPKWKCWEVPARPDQVLYVMGEELAIQSSFVSTGSSGGGLFNAQWEVVGMMVMSDAPRGYAISIDRVIDQVQAWRYPVDLKKTSIPRAGYRTSVGVALMAPSPAIDDRPPSGRVTVSSRAIPQVSWHAGLLRLAPENLAVTAGMAGVGLHLKKGRFALRPFLEAGFGHVEGQYDIGGYYVAAGGDTSYVPVYNRVEGDGLGVGGGAAVEFTVIPRTILELVTGYWSFTTPENAPRLNDLFIGAGLRVGL
ncbi:MAG: S1 family peptidase [Tepidiformaceae bacterium]